MPTYQYKCKSCDNRFEVVQKITESPLTDCPEPDCEGEIRRVLFPAGVVFKGSGWYVTDYRKDTEKAKYEAETKSESASPSSTTKTETKTAEAKTDTKSETKATETKTESKAASAST